MAQAALRHNTNVSPRKNVTAAHPDNYPDQYAKHVSGDCMAPVIANDSYVLMDKRKPCRRGDLVAIYLCPDRIRPGQWPILLKRVVMPLPVGVTLPYRTSAISNVMPLLIVEQDNPHRQYHIPADWLLAVHRCLGPVPADVTLVKDKANRVSAGMPSDLLNRRQAIVGLAYTLPAAGLASPATAGGAIPTLESPMNVLAKLSARTADAALIEAGREHARITVQIDRALQVSKAANAIYDQRRSPPPDPLRYDQADAGLGLQQPGHWRDGEFIPNEEGLYSFRDGWALRSLRNTRKMIPGYPEDHPKFGQPIPDGERVGEFMVDHILLVREAPARPEVVARVDEILAAMEAHQAEFLRLIDETGVTAAEEEIGRLNELLDAPERVLIETPARTIGGLIEKVRAWSWHDRNENGRDEEGITADDTPMFSDAAELMAVSIIRDLADMAGDSATLSL